MDVDHAYVLTLGQPEPPSATVSMTIDRMRSKPFLQEPARVPLVFAQKLSDDSRIRNRNNLHRKPPRCECGARVSARVPAGARELSGRLAVTSSTLLMIDSCV